MTDLRERFRDLRDLGPPPDIWARALQRDPSHAVEPFVPLRKRVAIGALAFCLSALAIGFVVIRFGADSAPVVPGGASAATVAFSGHTGSDIPSDIGFGDEFAVQDTLYLSSPGTALTPLTDDTMWAGPAAWSPSGDKLAFTTYDLDAQLESLFVFDSTTGERRLICEGCSGTFWVRTDTGCGVDTCWRPSAYPQPSRLAWSPDGRWLAVPETVDFDTEWYLIDVGDGSSSRLPTGPAWGVAWSPDGRLALSVSGREKDAGLYVFDPETGKANRLFDGYGTTLTAPAWSPDGQTIAYGVRVTPSGGGAAEIWQVDGDTGEGTVILPGEELNETVVDLEWSPDGRRLGVLADAVDAGPTLFVVEGQDKTFHALTACFGDADVLTCPRYATEISWSPDSRAISFVASAEAEDRFRDRLVSVEVATGEISPLTTDVFAGCCVAWRPTGSP